MIHSRNADLAREVIESWSHPDVLTSGRYFSEKATAWLAATDQPGVVEHHGTTMSARRWLELLQRAVNETEAGVAMIVHRIIADGEWVAVEVESRGVVRDGRLYNMRYTFWFEIQDGKVAQIRQYFDTAYGKAFFLPLMSER